MDSDPVLDEEQLVDEGEPDEAFALYRLLAVLPPHRRDVVPLAEITGHDVATVAAWSLMYRWHQRAAARDARFAESQELARRRILDRLAYLRECGPDAR